MALPKPNVEITVGKGGRVRAKVGGVAIAGVTGVEMVTPSHQETGPDGWVRTVRDGEPIVSIKVLARFVTIKPEPAGTDGE